MIGSRVSGGLFFSIVFSKPDPPASCLRSGPCSFPGNASMGTTDTDTSHFALAPGNSFFALIPVLFNIPNFIQKRSVTSIGCSRADSRPLELPAFFLYHIVAPICSLYISSSNVAQVINCVMTFNTLPNAAVLVFDIFVSFSFLLPSLVREHHFLSLLSLSRCPPCAVPSPLNPVAFPEISPKLPAVVIPDYCSCSFWTYLVA